MSCFGPFPGLCDLLDMLLFELHRERGPLTAEEIAACVDVWTRSRKYPDAAYFSKTLSNGAFAQFSYGKVWLKRSTARPIEWKPQYIETRCATASQDVVPDAVVLHRVTSRAKPTAPALPSPVVPAALPAPDARPVPAPVRQVTAERAVPVQMVRITSGARGRCS